MTENQVLVLAQTIVGWMETEELLWIIRTASSLKHGAAMVEIGAWCGRSTMAAGLALPQSSSLHVVDPMLSGYGANHLQKGDSAPEHLKITLSFLKKLRPDLDVRLYVGNSKQAAPHLPRAVDVLFIDGDHSYDWVKHDCLLANEVVKPGGLICGHDYGNRTDPGVAKAVDEIYGDDIRIAQGTSIWYIKQGAAT